MVLNASSFMVCDSSFSHNNGLGIHCPSETGGGVVSSCVISRNETGGLRLDGQGSSVTSCVFSGHRNSDTNDAAGLSVHASGNRIQGNSFVDNDRGAALFANGNPLYQNSTSNNTNPLFEDDGISGNVGETRSIDMATNPFSNILH